jgi:hypothetical protein
VVVEQELLRHIILPSLCHNDDDEALWHEDPYEYVRLKFDFFNDAVDPPVTAAILLKELIRKRVRPRVFGFFFLLLAKKRGVGGLGGAWSTSPPAVQGEQCMRLIFQFVFGLLTTYEETPVAERNPRLKDGLLHMLLTIGSDLLERAEYQVGGGVDVFLTRGWMDGRCSC